MDVDPRKVHVPWNNGVPAVIDILPIEKVKEMVDVMTEPASQRRVQFYTCGCRGQETIAFIAVNGVPAITVAVFVFDPSTAKPVEPSVVLISKEEVERYLARDPSFRAQAPLHVMPHDEVFGRALRTWWNKMTLALM